MEEKIKETAAYLASKIEKKPKTGLIIGTGLGSVTEEMDVVLRLAYEEIPNFPSTTVEGHRGTMAVGKLGGQSIIALEGRFHMYEGYTAAEITFPVRVLADLGVKYLLISSASGGLNPLFQTGDLMIVTDHINLTGTNPLIGPNLDSFGPRFPDMSSVYDPDLVKLACKSALEVSIPLRQGVYVGISGPSLETPAETRFLRMIGADAVGMSTVSEAIVGVHCGMKIIAIVVITNVNLPDCMQPTSLEKVIATARTSGLKLSALWKKIIEKGFIEETAH